MCPPYVSAHVPDIGKMIKTENPPNMRIMANQRGEAGFDEAKIQNVFYTHPPDTFCIFL